MNPYDKHCHYCKQPYSSKRAHSETCGGACRVAASRLLSEFDLIEEYLPYKTALSKYCQPPPGTIIYIKDYSVYDAGENTKFRYADVYKAKVYSEELAARMANKRVKIKSIRHTVNYTAILDAPIIEAKTSSSDNLDYSSSQKEKTARKNSRISEISQRIKQLQHEDIQKSLKKIKRRLNG